MRLDVVIENRLLGTAEAIRQLSPSTTEVSGFIAGNTLQDIFGKIPIDRLTISALSRTIFWQIGSRQLRLQEALAVAPLATDPTLATDPAGDPAFQKPEIVPHVVVASLNDEELHAQFVQTVTEINRRGLIGQAATLLTEKSADTYMALEIALRHGA